MPQAPPPSPLPFFLQCLGACLGPFTRREGRAYHTSYDLLTVQSRPTRTLSALTSLRRSRSDTLRHLGTTFLGPQSPYSPATCSPQDIHRRAMTAAARESVAAAAALRHARSPPHASPPTFVRPADAALFGTHAAAPSAAAGPSTGTTAALDPGTSGLATPPPMQLPPAKLDAGDAIVSTAEASLGQKDADSSRALGAPSHGPASAEAEAVDCTPARIAGEAPAATAAASGAAAGGVAGLG